MLDGEISFYYAYALYRTNNFKDALATLETCPETLESLYLKAQAAYRAELYDECLKAHDLLVAKHAETSPELLTNYLAAYASAADVDGGQHLIKRFSPLANKLFEWRYNAACVSVASGLVLAGQGKHPVSSSSSSSQSSESVWQKADEELQNVLDYAHSKLEEESVDAVLQETAPIMVQRAFVLMHLQEHSQAEMALSSVLSDDMKPNAPTSSRNEPRREVEGSGNGSGDDEDQDEDQGPVRVRDEALLAIAMNNAFINAVKKQSNDSKTDSSAATLLESLGAVFSLKKSQRTLADIQKMKLTTSTQVALLINRVLFLMHMQRFTAAHSLVQVLMGAYPSGAYPQHAESLTILQAACLWFESKTERAKAVLQTALNSPSASTSQLLLAVTLSQLLLLDRQPDLAAACLDPFLASHAGIFSLWCHLQVQAQGESSDANADANARAVSRGVSAGEALLSSSAYRSPTDQDALRRLLGSWLLEMGHPPQALSYLTALNYPTEADSALRAMCGDTGVTLPDIEVEEEELRGWEEERASAREVYPGRRRRPVRETDAGGMGGLSLSSEELEAGTGIIAGPTTTKAAAAKKDRQRENEKKHRKRKRRIPAALKDIPESEWPKADPERWIPKRQRSTYRPLRKTARRFRGPQGEVVLPATPGGSARGESAPTSSSALSTAAGSSAIDTEQQQSVSHAGGHGGKSKSKGGGGGKKKGKGRW